jgi:hypothetical protein
MHNGLTTVPFARQTFERNIVGLPPSIGNPFDASTPKIVELQEAFTQGPDRETAKGWHLVMFHADWNRRSRDVEIVFGRLSLEYATPSLLFFLTMPSLIKSGNSVLQIRL